MNNIIETDKDKQYLDKQYTPGEIKLAEKELINLMSQDEQDEFDKLSDVEKKYFISGFLDNIELYKKVKQNKGGGTPPPPMPQQPDPKKHLPQWSNGQGKKSKSKDGRQSIPIDQKAQEMENQSDDVQKQIENINNLKNNLQKAIDEVSNASPSNVQEKMENLKKAVEELRDAIDELAGNTESMTNNASDMIDEMNKAVNEINKAEKNNSNGSGSNDMNGSQSGSQSGSNDMNGSQSGSQSGSNDMNGSQSGPQSGSNDMNGSQSGPQSGSNDMNGSQSGPQSGSNDMNGSQSGSSGNGGFQSGTSSNANMPMSGKSSKQGTKASTLFNRAQTELQEALKNANNANVNANNTNRESSIAQREANKMGNNINQGGLKNVLNHAEEMLKNASRVQNDADKAKESTDKITEAAKKINDIKKQVANGGDKKSEDDGTSIFDNPILQEPVRAPEQNKKRVGHHTFDRSDIMNESIHNDIISHEDAKKMAKKAGHNYDSVDNQDPDITATKARTKINKMINDFKGPHGRGVGNSMIEIIDILNKMYAKPTINWRDKIEKFFTVRTPAEIAYKRIHKLIGLKNKGLVAGKGAHLRHTETIREKETGIAEVFFLVDTSGSMGRTAGDGLNIFVHIMTELIEMEKRNYIQRSAYANYNGGSVPRDSIIRWTNDTEPDEKQLKKYFGIPTAGGGTDVITAIKNIMKYDDVYNITDDPYTLLVVVTDGEDNWSNIGSIMSRVMMDNTIVVITQQDDNLVEKYVGECIKGGLPEDHVIGINYVDEWGEALNQPSIFKK